MVNIVYLYVHTEYVLLILENLGNKTIPLCAVAAKTKGFYEKELELLFKADDMGAQCPPPCRAVFYDGKIRTYTTGTNDTV